MSYTDGSVEKKGQWKPVCCEWRWSVHGVIGWCYCVGNKHNDWLFCAVALAVVATVHSAPETANLCLAQVLVGTCTELHLQRFTTA